MIIGTGRENAHIPHCVNCGYVGPVHPGTMSWELVYRCNCGAKMHYISFESGVEDDQVAALLDQMRKERQKVRFAGNLLTRHLDERPRCERDDEP